MRLIITRPEDDAVSLKANLENLGHSAILAPLLKIVARPTPPIPPANYQLICTTSANALKFFNATPALKKIPLLTVGPHSLAAAKAAGFTTCKAQGGDVHGLASHIIENYNPENGPILYLSGAETSADLQALLAAQNFTVDRLVIYDAIIQKSEGLAQALTAADGVLLYSPRSARIWCDIITTSGLETAASLPIYFCLSDNVANILPQHWQKRVAKTPDEAAMLALLD
jgi:uroporphyrinogen-III synthase